MTPNPFLGVLFHAIGGFDVLERFAPRHVLGANGHDPNGLMASIMARGGVAEKVAQRPQPREEITRVTHGLGGRARGA